MSARRLVPLAAWLALLAACNGTSSKPGPRLLEPSGLALFNGVTSHSPTTPYPYLAVTSLRGDELRLINPADGAAVLAPGKILALSVTTEARPSLVAAGRLGDVDGDGKSVSRPDLLVVASTGTSACPTAAHPLQARLTGCIQVVRTWADAGVIRTTVVDGLAIAMAEVAGAEDAIVRSLAVLPATDATGAVVPGKARVAAGLDGGRILLADFARTTLAAEGDAIVADGTPVLLDLGFDALSLAAAPGGARLYAATTDPLPAAAPLYGVAEVDVTGPLSATPRWRALDAGGPTTVVMAAQVRRFSAFRNTGDPATWDPGRDVYAAEALRVYAARAPGSCGPDLPVACGLVVLDPVAGGADGTGGRALDPAPAHPSSDRYQAEIPIAGQVTALTAIPPPTVGGLCDDGTNAPCASAGNPVSTMPYQPISVASATRWASTLGAAVSNQGSVYLLDLGHDGLVNARDWLSTTGSSTPAQVAAVTWATPTADKLELALWNSVDGPPATLSRDKTKGKSLVLATPGFTSTDSWTVSWQGGLPGLKGLAGQAKVDQTGLVAWIAIQRPTGLAERPFTDVGRLFDARFAIQPAVAGLRIGDIVQVTPEREPLDPAPVDTSVTPEVAQATQYCPFGTFELEVVDLLPPKADEYPGGAVQLREPTWSHWTQPVNAFGTTPAGAVRNVTADPRCMAQAGVFKGTAAATVAMKPVTLTVLSGELLLSGVNFGYAGRPTAQVTPGSPFLVQHDGSLDAASCPRLEAAALPGTACDQACQAACEALLLSRKARRSAYVYSQCASSDAVCLAAWSPGGSTTVNKLTFPNPGGPVIGLDLAWSLDGTTAVAPDLTDAATWPTRGTLLTVVTASGLVLETKSPAASGVATGTLLPNGVVAWDRPDFTQSTNDHPQIYTSYPANMLMWFSSTATGNTVGLIR